jgi:hypothetical protein
MKARVMTRLEDCDEYNQKIDCCSQLTGRCSTKLLLQLPSRFSKNRPYQIPAMLVKKPSRFITLSLAPSLWPLPRANIGAAVCTVDDEERVINAPVCVYVQCTQYSVVYPAVYRRWEHHTCSPVSQRNEQKKTPSLPRD